MNQIDLFTGHRGELSYQQVFVYQHLPHFRIIKIIIQVIIQLNQLLYFELVFRIHRMQFFIERL